MTRTFIGVAALTALSLTGLSAHASCADPRTAAQQGAFQATPALLSPRDLLEKIVVDEPYFL